MQDVAHGLAKKGYNIAPGDAGRQELTEEPKFVGSNLSDKHALAADTA